MTTRYAVTIDYTERYGNSRCTAKHEVHASSVEQAEQLALGLVDGKERKTVSVAVMELLPWCVTVQSGQKGMFGYFKVYRSEVHNVEAYSKEHAEALARVQHFPHMLHINDVMEICDCALNTLSEHSNK